MARGKGKGPMGMPLEGEYVMDKYQVIDLIDKIINEDLEEGEPNDLKNEPSQDPEEELERVEDDLGGDEGEALEDYMEGEDEYDEDDYDEDEMMEMVELMVDSTLLDQDNAYQAYFRNVMKKHNIDGIKGLSPEKKREFFKDVSSGWKNHKESIDVEEQQIFEDYKKYFKYLTDQCGIEDVGILEEEDLVQLYALVHEAFEVGMLYESYKDVFKNVMDKFDVSSIKDLKGDEKKDFFNQLDAAWKGKEEKEISSVRDKVTDLLK